MSDATYNLETARSEEQRQQMVELGARGVCAFCRQNAETEMREPIELETKFWYVKKNDYPYKRTKLHLVLISQQHVKTLSDLNSEALHDLADTIVKIEKQWQLTSYGVGIRSGDMHYNGGSVEHIHAHIVVGDPENGDPEPVRFKMSSRPKT